MNNQFYDSLKNNQLLKNSDIASLNLEEVKGRLLRVGEGEIVYREGAPSDFIYLVVSGQINIIKKKVLGKAKSYVYKENEFFGNDEYFEETSRTSTAVALVDSYLICLSREELENLILQDNEIYLSLRENLNDLFDDSTEINISEEESHSDHAPAEIEKVITGEEIETGISAAGELPEELPVQEASHEFNDETFKSSFDESLGITPLEQNGFSLDDRDLYTLEKTAIEIDDVAPAIETNDDKKIDEDILASVFSIDEPVGQEPVLHSEQPDELIIHDEEITGKSESIDDIFEKAGDQKNSSFEPDEVSSVAIQSEDNVIRFDIDKNPAAETIESLPAVGTGGEMNKDEVTKIINAMELVNSTVKIDDLLTSIVNVATDLTSADRGTLYLVDKEKGELWSKIAMGTEPKEIRLKLGEGIAGTVARTKKIENIKDVSSHPMFKKDVDKSSGYVTRNMLCFPLKNKEEEVIGVLQLLNSKKGEFTEHDEEVLSMISINTAIALQNADLVEKLLTAERVSSLGKMTNFLIQDIKKPVLVSKRYTEHLKSKSLAPEVGQLVDMILTELTQVSDLVQTTSSYAEGKTILRTAVTGINGVLQDFVSRMDQFITARRCKIYFEPDKEFNVKLDTKEFFQCFQHIVKNACDAMPDGGTLKISTKVDGKSVRIIFEDQGLGIPESFIDKIFEPFMTHGKKEGAGLGLSITKKIVEAHQGTIEVRSSLGAGATFTITLPAGA